LGKLLPAKSNGRTANRCRLRRRFLERGGTASSTILSGSEIVLGTDTGTTVGSGGLQSVYLDGTALSATVNGGGIQVVGGAGQLGSLNFNSGTADQSGGNNNLLLSGGATLATGGLYGSALSLDGAEGSYAIDSINNPAFDFGSNDFYDPNLGQFQRFRQRSRTDAH
jgi:autotransporter passenger strand-loop-strand repeat protein